MTTDLAPDWRVARWLNTPVPLTLKDLRGRVILLHVFQMLCPGCVLHGLPQAQRVARTFADAPLTVIGLHSVFEHHAVMGPEALEVFVAEHRLDFPVAIDDPGRNSDPRPLTMRAYALEGTPSTLLYDGHGRLRRKIFGIEDDLLLGAELGALLREAELEAKGATATFAGR